MKTTSKIRRINKLFKRIKRITKGSHLEIGSPSRITFDALENWGVKAMPENVEWLKEKSRNDYKKDWERADNAIYDAIGRAIEASGLSDGNNQLNNCVAELTVPIIVNMGGIKAGSEKIVMCDIGAGVGGTTGAILEELKKADSRLLRRLSLRFIEPSKGITKIRDLMEAYPQIENPQFIGATDYSYLPTILPGSFDIVVSNAVFHHNSFPDYINDIHQVLKDDGVCIVGDWYSEVWHHPEFVAYVMKEGLRMHEEDIMLFLACFGIKNFETVRQFWNSCADDVKLRNEGMLKYIKNIGEEMKALGKKLSVEEADYEESTEDSTDTELPPPEKITADVKKISKLSLLEGHETHGPRKKKFEDRNFETDPDKIKQCKACKGLEKVEIEAVSPMFAVVNVFPKKSIRVAPDTAASRKTHMSMPPPRIRT